MVDVPAPTFDARLARRADRTATVLQVEESGILFRRDAMNPHPFSPSARPADVVQSIDCRSADTKVRFGHPVLARSAVLPALVVADERVGDLSEWSTRPALCVVRSTESEDVGGAATALKSTHRKRLQPPRAEWGKRDAAASLTVVPFAQPASEVDPLASLELASSRTGHAQSPFGC